MTPDRRADAILRGWITEAVGTGTAHEEQLRAFIAAAIGAAEAEKDREIARCKDALRAMAADCPVCLGTGTQEVRDYDRGDAPPHPAYGPLPRAKSVPCRHCTPARRLLGE